MKVALVVPEAGFTSDIAPPLNLGYLAAVILQKYPDFEVKIFDGSVTKNVWGLLLKFQPDLVGVTATTPQAPQAYSLLDSLHKCRPDIFTVIGGIHASCLPEEASNHADCVVVGEGEKAILQIIDSLVHGQKPERIIEGEPVEDLDSLPSPAYELMNLDRYIHRAVGYVPALSETPVIRLVAQRGCPFSCVFCYNSKRPTKVRYLSAKRIIEELQFLVEHYNIKSVWFHDDEFLVNSKRLEEFCSLLHETGLKDKIHWSCASRVTSVTKEKLLMIKGAGCVSLFFGIESYSATSLAYLKRNTVKVSEIDNAVKLCNDLGVPFVGSFIVGCPNETLGEMQETLNWITAAYKNGRLAMAGINVLTPYPGTRLWDSLENSDIDYSRLRWNIPLKQRVIVNQRVPFPAFERFVKQAFAVSWMINARHELGLVRTIFSKTFIRRFFDNPKILLLVTAKNLV